MEVTPDDTKKEEKGEEAPEVQSRDVVRVSSRRSSGDVPKRSEVTKSSSNKEQVPRNATKALFANTRMQMRSFRRGLKKVWNLWSGFTKSPGSIPPKKKKKQQTGVPGFEEIACIEVEVPDIMMTDKDKIRTSCKQCVKNPPKFPTKEQVKTKLIAADKYYGVTRLAHKRNMNIERSGSLEHDADYYDEDGKIIRPSWRFILERPLVEQYVLMTNYIRKISILSELEDPEYGKGVEEEEEDLGSDSEYNKFTEKHKIETENLLASLRAPKTKDISVQTTTKSSEHLVEPASETSLYPDSGSSNESSPSKELSAVTIVTSRDFSSPLHSDLDNRSIANSLRVKNAVKWWESKDPPPTSESFPTSCDSVRNMSVSNRISSEVRNEPVKDTSGSGSDGMSIPVHNAAGKTSLFKLNPTENNQSLGGRIRNEKQTNLAQDTPATVEKGTATQKKVTFSPVVEYFNSPERNNAVFSLPTEEEVDNSTEPTSELEETTSQRLKETKNRFPNKTLFTLSPNQKHVVLQLGTSPKQGNTGFSILQSKATTESSGSTNIYFQQQHNRYTSNAKKLQPETKIPLKPFAGVEPRASSSEYRSTSPETVNAPSSSDYRSSPERKPERLLTSGRYEQQTEENKESSSNSSERIELKPSPAVFFRPGHANTITNLATDKFYPEVPDIDEVKNERLYQNSMYQEERRDICSFPENPPKNQGLVKVVIVQGTSPHNNSRINDISINSQQSNQHRMESLAVKEELDHLQHRSSKHDSDYSKTIGSEPFHGTYIKIEDVGQPSHARQVSEAAAETRQSLVQRSLLNELHGVASAPLDMDYNDSTKNRKSECHPFTDLRKTEQQGNDESMTPRAAHQRITVHRELQKIPEMYSSTQFLNAQHGDASQVSERAAGTRQFSVYRSLLDDLHGAASTPLDTDYKDPSKNHTGEHQPFTSPRNTEQQENDESMISRTQKQRTTTHRELQKMPEIHSSAQLLSVQQGGASQVLESVAGSEPFHGTYIKIEDVGPPSHARHVSEAAAETRQSSVQRSLLDDLHGVSNAPLDTDNNDLSKNYTGECHSFTNPRKAEQQGNDESMIPRAQHQRITVHRELQKIPEMYSSTQFLSVQKGDASQVPQSAAGIRQSSVHRSLLDDLHGGVNRAPLHTDYKDLSKNHTDECQPFIYLSKTEQQGNDESITPRTQQQRTTAYLELQKMPEIYSGAQFLSVQLMKDCTIQSNTGFDRSIPEEERSDLKRNTPCANRQEASIDVYDRTITGTEKQLKGTPRMNTVTSTLTSDHIMSKISEELNYSSIEICQSQSPISLRSEVHIESQEKVRERCSYEDFCKFDVLKMSQIYTSSSSFVTSSEERMACGLSKFDGTIFRPMLVEEIIPEVSMMPSKTLGSLISADRVMSSNDPSVSIDEHEMNKYPSQDQIKTEQRIDDPNLTRIYSTQSANKCISQDQKRNVQEINFPILTQIQYPTQLELLTPCYTLIGNMQYSTHKKVEIMTEKIVSTVIPQVKNEADTKNVIESNIDYVLQKVHETIHNQADRIQSAVTNEDNTSIAPKKWLTHVIPTVIKGSTRAQRQSTANNKIQDGGSSSVTTNPADVKPVFRFLKKQRETQKNNE